MKTTALNQDDERRVRGARMAKLGVRLLNRYGRLLQCKVCATTWSPQPALDGSLCARFLAMSEPVQLVKSSDANGRHGGTVADIENQTMPGSNIAFFAAGVQPIVLRLEDLPATPRNLERIRQQVEYLNRRLALSGTPFRLRVI